MFNVQKFVFFHSVLVNNRIWDSLWVFLEAKFSISGKIYPLIYEIGIVIFYPSVMNLNKTILLLLYYTTLNVQLGPEVSNDHAFFCFHADDTNKSCEHK